MGTKNNPRNRDRMKLLVLCPETGEPMIIVKRIPGGKMFYKSEGTGEYYPISRGSYKNFEYKWVKK
jgi:hypothetical protein